MNHCERNKTSVTTEGFTSYSVNGDIQWSSEDSYSLNRDARHAHLCLSHMTQSNGSKETVIQHKYKFL